MLRICHHARRPESINGVSESTVPPPATSWERHWCHKKATAKKINPRNIIYHTKIGIHPFFPLFDVVSGLLKGQVSSNKWDDVERIAVKSGDFPLRADDEDMKYSAAPVHFRRSYPRYCTIFSESHHSPQVVRPYLSWSLGFIVSKWPMIHHSPSDDMDMSSSTFLGGLHDMSVDDRMWYPKRTSTTTIDQIHRLQASDAICCNSCISEAFSTWARWVGLLL